MLHESLLVLPTPASARRPSTAVNLHGVFHCIQAVLPDMIEAGWGRIVNISSSSTHSGTPYMAHYVSAKSAVNGLTKTLALEYGPDGITVNAVPPGFIDTPMLRNAEGRGLLGDIEKTIEQTPVRPDGQARRHCGSVRLSGLRGIRLYHRADPRSQRRAKHVGQNRHQFATQRRFDAELHYPSSAIL